MAPSPSPSSSRKHLALEVSLQSLQFSGVNPRSSDLERERGAGGTGSPPQPVAQTPYRKTIELMLTILFCFTVASVATGVPLSTLSANTQDTADYVIVLVGSFLSIIGACMLINTTWFLSPKEFDSMILVISAACGDLFQGLFYFSTSISRVSGDAAATTGKRCVVSSFFAQFVWFAVVCWGASLALHAFLTYNFPLTYGKTAKKYLMVYHLVCWSSALFTAFIGAFTAPSQPYVANSYCWVSDTYKTAIYNGPVCAIVALELAALVYITAQISGHPAQRKNDVHLNTLIWITRVTVSYTFANIWYFGVDFNAPDVEAWSGIVGDVFSASQGFINFLLWFPSIYRSVSKRRAKEQLEKLEVVNSSPRSFASRRESAYLHSTKRTIRTNDDSGNLKSSSDPVRVSLERAIRPDITGSSAPGDSVSASYDYARNGDADLDVDYNHGDGDGYGHGDDNGIIDTQMEGGFKVSEIGAVV